MSPIEIVSLDFLLLTLITLVIYYLLTPRLQTVWLLAVSYAFYATWGGYYLAVLIVSTALNYFIARRIEKTKSRPLLFSIVTLNAASLIALKFITGPYGLSLLTTMTGETRATELTAILLPIGFSFYVLQIISYLIDIYRGQTEAEEDFIHFALYLAYFPKMLAGPIERAKAFLPQLKRERLVDKAAVEQGLYLILLGLLRKWVIADHLAPLLPADVFVAPGDYASLERAVWVLVFAFMVYNDFAGYTSIVRGVSKLLGIELSPNFRQPFLARSFSDFWTRWHITLSEWLRDYIFYPLRRWLMSQRWDRRLALFIPPLIAMLASGYWHGAYLALLLWGFVHGLYLVFEQILQQFNRFPKEGWKARAYSVFVFLAVTLAWIPFNAPSVRAAGRFLVSLPPPYSAAFNPIILPDVILLPLFSIWLDAQEQRYADPSFPRAWSPAAQAWSVAIALILLWLFSNTGTDLSGFVYQGF